MRAKTSSGFEWGVAPNKKQMSPIMFWLKTTITENGCAEWTGAKLKFGYGAFSWPRPVSGIEKKGGNWIAHRWIWTYLNGPIPDGMVVRHLCNNSGCVNHEHLALGTQKQNIGDMMMAGRHRNQAKTHCKRGHEFTSENIRWEYGFRQCRACDDQRQRKYRARREVRRAEARRLGLRVV